MKKTFISVAITAALALFPFANGSFNVTKADDASATTTATSTATSTATTTVAVATTTTVATIPDCPPTAADMSQIQASAGSATKELAARQALLTQVITCAKTDADALQVTLTTAPVPSDATNIQSTLSGKIDDAIDYYNTELSEVGTTDSVAGTQAIAKDVLQWKTANYDPLAGQVSNLILWSQNQDLFGTAQNRMTQTTNIVSFLQSAAQNDTLQADMSSTQAIFQTALTENQDAENALAELLPPDQSLIPIQQSLQDLATTYQDFSNTDALIQTLLPTGN